MDGSPGIMPSSMPGWPSGWLRSVPRRKGTARRTSRRSRGGARHPPRSSPADGDLRGTNRVAGAAGVCMVRYSDHTLYGGSEHDITNSNGRNIAIVTGSALGLGYGLTKRLIADGWFVAGIDTAFYRVLPRQPRLRVGGEAAHLHGSGRTGLSDPVQSGQRREPDRLRHPHRTQLPLSRMSSAGSAAMQVALLRARRLSDPRAACTGPCR